MLEYLKTMSPESITALSVAIVTAISAIVAAVVRAVQAVSAMSGTLSTITHALGIGEDETIRQSVTALRTEVVSRLDQHEQRIVAIESTCPVSRTIDPDAPPPLLALQ